MIQIIIFILFIALIISALPFVILVGLLFLIYKLTLHILKEQYFKSEQFLSQKEKVAATIDEYNEISEYISNLNKGTDFKIKKEQFKHAHLAKYTNTSAFNIKRDRNKKEIQSENVHQTSLQVVKKASEEPIKYLCKYFNILTTDETLTNLQETTEALSRFNAAKENLKLRQDDLTSTFQPPKFIKKYYMKEFLNRLDVKVPEISIEYPVYTFEYVSAGGNSSQKTTIEFNEDTIEATAEYIADKLNNMKSAKYQRSLMTRKLREYIKQRDNHTCLSCGVSTREQSLLLLEVDHVIPVSKGGLSTEENLQTLCWKCNRTKSDKVMDDEI